MQTSEQINELAAALAIAQGCLRAAPKNAKNPHFKSKYADLAGCVEAARPHLAANGLTVVQSPVCHEDTGWLNLKTRLIHGKSGQWIETICGCRPRSLGPQDVGSAITYMRRYGFCAIVGVVAEDEDDDGNAAERGAADFPADQRREKQQKPAKKNEFEQEKVEQEKVAKEQPRETQIQQATKTPLFNKDDEEHKRRLWTYLGEPRTTELAKVAASLLHGVPFTPNATKDAIEEARIQLDKEPAYN